MAFKNVLAGLLLLFSVYAFSSAQKTYAAATPSGSNQENNHAYRSRGFVRFLPRNPYSKVKSDDFIVDDDEFTEILKRQTADDYGHLRFGKRGEMQFDDYGHMRFGRSSASSS